MDPQSSVSQYLLYLSYRNWRLMIALGVGVAFCFWRLRRRSREAWLVAGAIFLVAFHEVGVHWVQMRAIWVLSNDAGIPIEKSVGWFNFVFGALYTLVITTAWGLIFYAAFGPGSGAKPTYLIEDERSAKESN